MGVRAAARLAVALSVVVVVSLLGQAGPTRPREARAATLPGGFTESVVFSGLVNPTVVRFAPDGRIFVAEKSGLIKVFDNLADTTPTVFADLRTNVHNFWDRGLLGMALDPSFAVQPSVYVLYTYDHALGASGGAPRGGRSAGHPTAARRRPGRPPTGASSAADSLACRRPGTR